MRKKKNETPAPEPAAEKKLQPWDRQPNESRQAYEAFLQYRDIDASTRSIREAYRKATGRTTSDGQPWREFSARWNWPARAEAWDDHLRAIEQKATEALRARRAAQLEKLREEQREREMRHAAAIEERATKLLALPHVVATAKYEDGRVQTQAPAHAAEFRAATDMLRTARNFMRLALEMPQDLHRFELTGKDGEPVNAVPTTLTDEERIDRLAAILDVARARRAAAAAAGGAAMATDPEQSAGDGLPEPSG